MSAGYKNQISPTFLFLMFDFLFSFARGVHQNQSYFRNFAF